MEILGLAEIAAMLGVKKQVVTNWKSRKASFPKPMAILKSGPIWSQEAIAGWIEAERKRISDRSDRKKINADH